VTKAVGLGDWAQVFEPRRRSSSIPKLIGAAAVGGALMYFLDPVRGPERRRSMIATSRRAVDKIVNAAKTFSGQAGDSAADSEDRVKSRMG
jgi:hypothetical protein